MRSLFKVAIVGRPNVGKSALFNRICGKRISIVDEAEGVTRDRLYHEVDVFGRPILLIDTGGINRRSKVPFNEEIRRQAEIAVEEADSLILVVDVTVGVTELDREVAKLILRKKKQLCLAINKVDSGFQQEMADEFCALGISKMVKISANHGHQIAELLECALENYRPPEEIEDDKRIKVAIVGRANVGKSTLINYILGEQRCVVSPIPGTTRDSIDVDIEVEGTGYTFIDTAGIRRKSAELEVVDKFAAIRTERAISRADICILVVDAVEGMTTQEKRIATTIEEQGKGCIILLNKWDLVHDVRMEHALRDLNEAASFLEHCPTHFISALKGRNVHKIFDSVRAVYTAYQKRVPTGQLNSFVEKAMHKINPPMLRGKRLRIYYMAQVGVAPPRFVAFVNDEDLMADSYKKYLINQFRKEFDFPGIPIDFTLKGKGGKRAEQEASADSRLEKIAEEKSHLLDQAEEELEFEELDG